MPDETLALAYGAAQDDEIRAEEHGKENRSRVRERRIAHSPSEVAAAPP
jgi:hypothetical protein